MISQFFHWFPALPNDASAPTISPVPPEDPISTGRLGHSFREGQDGVELNGWYRMVQDKDAGVSWQSHSKRRWPGQPGVVQHCEVITVMADENPTITCGGQ
jgi:hypothetical protein